VEDEPKNNSFWAFGTDLIDPGDWVSYPLEFDSSEEAENAYATLRKHQHDGSMPTLELLEWAVESVKILDQGLDSYMTRAKAAEAANTTKDTAASKVTEITDTTNTKLPFGQRLKKAWFVLTGKNT
jgi:hypothetical protein